MELRNALILDPDGKTIAAYGLTNKEVVGKKFGKVSLDGIPYPGTMLLDKQGVIRAKLFFDGYKERQTADDIIKVATEAK